MTAPTPEQRQQWRALADGATEGPWEAARDRDNWIVGDLWNGLNGMVGGFAAGGGPQAEADAAFIAAAREAVPALLADLEAAEARAEKAEAAIARPWSPTSSTSATPSTGVTTMTDRIEAVAAALDTHYQRLTMDSVYQCACGVRGYRSEWPQHLAAVAVAQVNLLAPAEPTEAVVEAAVARAVLAERDRIARTIGQEWQRRSDEWGYRVDSHQEGVLDGLAEAEEIARGIDPGEVE